MLQQGVNEEWERIAAAVTAPFTEMKFEWDPAKNRRNQAKHGVSFEEAATVFGDRFAMTWEDADHSLEYRLLTLGYTEQHRLVIVAHVERGNRVRLISARPATSAERRIYESE